MKKIFIIAGEASGDYLGGRLMEDLRKICDRCDIGSDTDKTHALQARCDDSVEFFGIGGPCMEKAGLRKLFSINELSIMGIVEVIGKIFRIKRLINKTVDAVFIYDPDVIITIDSSGFTHRVNRKIKKQRDVGSNNDKTHVPQTLRVLQAPIIHYVAPPVWAWRAWRAKSMHEFIDKLLVLLPFEPELFVKHGLETVFVGHPIALDSDFEKPDDFFIEDFRDALGLSDDTKLIVLLPGSRMAEISKHLPILEEFANLMVARYRRVKFIIPTTESLKETVESITVNWQQRPIVIKEKSLKVLAYYASDLAVAASGTVTLELARTGLPAVIIYKTSFVTYLIVKFLLKIENVCLINIIAKQNVVPELLQNDCTAQNVFHHAVSILEDPKKTNEQKQMFAKVMNQLSVEDRYTAAMEVIKTKLKQEKMMRF
ncbi:lipid-A-disaccharide synthase [Alphaproteobacteria bacterium]|nr:lipid-A-disaccharide synthase [Alphaproteobacteria bacterium]